MSIDTLSAAPRADAAPAFKSAVNPAKPRVDLYASIHRALRMFMADTLVKVGALDPEDPIEMASAMAQLGGLLAACRSHLAHENEYVHTAIEARRAGGSLRIAGEHDEHLEAIAALEAEAATLVAAPGAQLALRLYRHLALFVAENFEHMQREETAHNQALWDSYTDDELMAIEHRIVASLAPEEMAAVLRWMAPALPPAERAAWLGAMQQQMPPEVFRTVLDAVRPTLDDRNWAKLSVALGLPGRPWPVAG